MIQIINLTKSFGSQVLYDDITLSINSREKIGLVGRNGHGKTTLFNLILGKMNPDSGTVTMPKGYRIGHLEQHINFTQDTVLNEGCLGLKPEDKYDTWKVEKILSGLGFSKEDMEKHPSVFSGGYQIRINLAKVLVSEPNMLMLDEPNNYLDIVAKRWLINFLRAWQNELILITHDRGFMDSITTHTVAIHRKKIRKVKGGTDKLYGQIEKEEDVYEKTRVNEENKRRQLEVFIGRFRAKARLATQVQSKIKALEKMGEKEQLEKIEKLSFSFNSIPFVSDQMMSAEEISFSYSPETPLLLNKFTMTIGKRERICVIGKNGKGKSTLLKILAGELSPLSGRMKVSQGLKLGYFGQPNLIRLRQESTVLDEIISASPACSLQAARNIAGTLMFREDAALKPVSVLSGGEKNRVLLAKIVISPCQLLLLDEPSNHLDMDSCEALMEAIDEFDGSAVIVTHNEDFLKRLARRLVIFDEDSMTLYEGGYQDFLDNVGWKDEKNNEEEQRIVLSSPYSNRQDVKRQEGENRRLKAEKTKEIMRERDSVMKPLNSDINKLERKISSMDREIQANNEILVKASADGNVQQIVEASRKNKALKQEIDPLYDKLDELTKRHENLKTEFEEKLKGT